MSYQEGPATAKAIQWDFGFSGQDNKEQICVQFEITEGPDAGKTINYYGFFTEKTQTRTMESLRYCGWKNDDLLNMEGMGDYLVQIIIANEEFEGKWRAKVRWVNRLGGGGPIKLEKPMDMAQKRMFAAKMRMLAKTVAKVSGGYPAASRADTEVPGGSAHGGKEDPF